VALPFYPLLHVSPSRNVSSFLSVLRATFSNIRARRYAAIVSGIPFRILLLLQHKWQKWIITFYLFLYFILFIRSWGHSPKDIEHVKNSCNINKAKYVQSMERRQSINLNIHVTLSRWKYTRLNSNTHQPKL
jgi:hypothetical protein